MLAPLRSATNIGSQSQVWYTRRLPSGDQATLTAVSLRKTRGAPPVSPVSGKRRRRPVGPPPSQISDPSAEKPTLRAGTFVVVHARREIDETPGTDLAQPDVEGPSRSAMKATNLPSGEMAASCSVPSQLVKRVNRALASGLSTDGGGRCAPSQPSERPRRDEAQYDGREPHHRLPARMRRRHAGGRLTGIASSTCRARHPP